jgi:hypothetical protein
VRSSLLQAKITEDRSAMSRQAPINENYRLEIGMRQIAAYFQHTGAENDAISRTNPAARAEAAPTSGSRSSERR